MDVVSQIKIIMKESCDQSYSIEQLCEKIKVPYHTFRKLFRRQEGISLQEYKQLCRVQKAEELLSVKDKYIFEIAHEIGFSSDSNFATWFKKRKGITPKAYRELVHRDLV